MNIFQDLQQRGLIHNSSNNIDNLLPSTNNKITFYIGFDPTNNSLHVGSLLGIITAIRFIQHGHKAIFLIGGATGLIGDPSGKSIERNLLDKDLVQQNAKAIQEQINLLMTMSGIHSDNFEFVNNISWLENMNILSFLRNIGKHVKVNNLLNKDSIKKRLNSEEGISFTEFTYNLIQAFDFAHLANTKGCNLQLGGSDQWGNIISGIDLSRKLFNLNVHGLTFPLLTNQNGTKFGKTEKGTIFLDKNKTSPFSLFQFFLNLSDEEAWKIAPMLLPWNHQDIINLIENSKKLPNKRFTQFTLASTLTKLIHGNIDSSNAEFNSITLFNHNANKEELSRIDFNSIINDIPHITLSPSHIGQPIINSLANIKNLFTSKSEIKNLIKTNGISINNLPLENDKISLQKNMLIKNKFLLVKKGKRNLCILSLQDP